MTNLLGVSDDVGESASLEKLHDDPQFVTNEEAVVHVNDVGVVIVAHDHNLNKEKCHKRKVNMFYTHKMYLN